jgi:cyclopropane-fatty-acyl-phospholipid synthase
MIRSYIFPGGMLPSPTRFSEESSKAGLKTTDRFEFGQDYALTLEHWLANFERRLKEVRRLGYDEPFIRLWRFYLSACAATFRVGRTSVMQVELQHA